MVNIGIGISLVVLVLAFVYIFLSERSRVDDLEEELMDHNGELTVLREQVEDLDARLHRRTVSDHNVRFGASGDYRKEPKTETPYRGFAPREGG